VWGRSKILAAPRKHGVTCLAQIDVGASGERHAAAAFNANDTAGRGDFVHLASVFRWNNFESELVYAIAD
jgi:hypothetical protein